MNQNTSNKRFYYALIGIGVIIITSSFWGGTVYKKDIYKRELERLQGEIEKSEEIVIQLENELLCLEAEDSEDEVTQEDNYNNFLTQKSKDYDIEKEIDSLLFREYSKRYLDSLKSSVRFN